MRNRREIKIKNVTVGGGNQLVFIGGPCVIEGRDVILSIAEKLKNITSTVNIPFIFKSSYDKANRSSLKSFRGPGIEEGLRILEEVKREFDVPILSDVHTSSEVSSAKEVLDVLQIPAFLCRQTDFIMSVAGAGLPVNVKKGQFLAPWDMKTIIEKIEFVGCKSIMLTERGTTFGYNNLVTDMRSLVIMGEFGCPVIFDVTHSLQLPGGMGETSGGESSFIPAFARAGTAVGVDGIFLEVHPNPEKALCDGPNSLKLDFLFDLLRVTLEIDNLVRGN
ncbi:MAG: 3-deoxy-8-phosphooctulonate synthase [Thermodesulfobacteriota bacterium]|nr:3-deoxy-8-phosphooctulonate synthase [Thermodesulfobacteriota bacterium]